MLESAFNRMCFITAEISTFIEKDKTLAKILNLCIKKQTQCKSAVDLWRELGNGEQFIDFYWGQQDKLMAEEDTLKYRRKVLWNEALDRFRATTKTLRA